MKKMKLTGGIIVSALILALSACGGQTAVSTSDTSDTTVGSVTTAPDDNSWKSAATYTLADGSIDESNIDVAPETVEALEYIGEEVKEQDVWMKAQANKLAVDDKKKN